MVEDCKFRIEINNKNMFYCGADANGWAFLWRDEKFENPCEECKKYKSGRKTFINKELSPSEFWNLAGGIITAKDWKRMEGI